MKIVLTCGHPTSGYQMVHQVLLNSGLGEAQASRREQFSPQEIQKKFCVAHEIEMSYDQKLTKVSPGMVWQNLAVDLFVANLEQENWGWADDKTIFLLDFWHDFDPQVRLILAYSSPATALAGLSQGVQGDLKPAVAEILHSWFVYNQELLYFYTRHRDRCLLVNTDALARTEGQEKLLPLLREERGLALNRVLTVATASEMHDSPILGLIAEQMLEKMPEIEQLFQELESTADIFSSEVQSRSVLAELAVAEYQKLSFALTAGRQALQSLAVEKKQIEVHASEQAGALGKLKAQLSEREAKSAKIIESLQQENELLLLQLHQVQEELEKYFLSAKSALADNEKLEHQLAT
ncbi:MAG: hypothetical protein PHV02_04720, partial [Rhodocyclaceae bacterium]|nr:hypothetical protein [Rhodocyclaceae bacterium]